MTEWASSAGSHILDPGAGSGRLIQTFERMNASHSAHSVKPYIRAYEISPLVLLIAQVNAALANSEAARLDFRLDDFLTAPVETEAFDAVICNPPYTRHHHLGEKIKNSLISRTSNEFGIRPSGFTSLFVYFFIRAISSVKQGGKLAFITPSELYEASYSVPFKQILKENATPAAIITFDRSHQVFEGVDTAGCVTLATRGHASHSATALIEIASWPGAEMVLEAIETQDEGQHAWGKVKFADAQSLEISAKWSNLRQMSAPLARCLL